MNVSATDTMKFEVVDLANAEVNAQVHFGGTGRLRPSQHPKDVRARLPARLTSAEQRRLMDTYAKGVEHGH